MGQGEESSEQNARGEGAGPPDSGRRGPGEAGETERPLIGIALGGGVARGFTHIGVLRALARHGIRPDLIAGTSAGALVGGCYLAGVMDALEDWACGLNRMKILSYLDFRIRTGGLIGGHRLFALMREHLGTQKIEHLPRPFIAIACDMVTGHEVWLRKGRLAEAIRASFALPGVFPPVNIGGRRLVDGALVNPVPVAPLTAMGAQMTIAVNCNADLIGRLRSPDGVPRAAGFDLLNEDAGTAAVRSARANPVARRVFRRQEGEPSLFGVMVSALNIVQDRLSRSRLAAEPPDVQIAPRVGHIGPLEFDRATELIAEGEAAVERALPDLQAALAIFASEIPTFRGSPPY